MYLIDFTGEGDHGDDDGLGLYFFDCWRRELFQKPRV